MWVSFLSYPAFFEDRKRGLLSCIHSGPSIMAESQLAWDEDGDEAGKEGAKHPVKAHVLCAQSSLTLCGPMDCSPSCASVCGILQARLLGVGFHFLLQRIFPTQGLNSHPLHLLHWQMDHFTTLPPGKPY